MVVSLDIGSFLVRIWDKLFPKKSKLEIVVKYCYHVWNDQPISTIYAEFIIHNRGEKLTTIYEVELMSTDPEEIISGIIDTKKNPMLTILPDIPKNLRVRFSYPDYEVGKDPIGLVLKISHSHKVEEIKCTSNYIE